MFSFEFQEIFKKAFFKEHLWWLLLDFIVQINFRTYSVSASSIFYSQAIYFDFFPLKNAQKLHLHENKLYLPFWIFSYLELIRILEQYNEPVIGPENGTQ